MREVEQPSVSVANQNWDNFVYWARRLTEHEQYGQEREYKLEIASHLISAKEAVLAGRGDWLERLKRAFGPPNNLTSWQKHTLFLEWVSNHQSSALELLTTIWDGNDVPEDRMSRFFARLPKEAVAGNGSRTSFGSFLLLAVDATKCPPYRPQVFRTAIHLVGYPADVSKQSDERATYRHALGFLDRFIAEGQARGVTIQDRLDAQGLVWNFSGKDLPVSWSEEDRDAFGGYRGDPAVGTVWILQGNPKRFGIDDYLTRYPFVYWSAPKYQKKLSIGERVFIWRSGENAGVVALGRIAELAGPRQDVERPDALGEDLWVDEPDEPTTTKIGIDVEEVRLTSQDKMIPRQSLKDNECFKNATIIRQPNGTVYPLTLSERGVLETLWAGKRPKPEPRPSLDVLAQELRLEPLNYLSRIERLLIDKGQVIFNGPPGTGKTFIARKLATHLTGSKDRVRIVQFHPSYAYEDFVEGYRPQEVKGQPGFKLMEGPLRRLAP